ncbi:hypothetical protein T439DRAFT_351766, partial [Meredithblackwellia eburnea MCA 4105]
MSSQHLPFELLLRIFSHLDNTTYSKAQKQQHGLSTTYLNLALVCKAWLPAGLCKLDSEIDIEWKPSTVQKFERRGTPRHEELDNQVTSFSATMMPNEWPPAKREDRCQPGSYIEWKPWTERYAPVHSESVWDTILRLPSLRTLRLVNVPPPYFISSRLTLPKHLSPIKDFHYDFSRVGGNRSLNTFDPTNSALAQWGRHVLRLVS